jgi:putative transposase
LRERHVRGRGGESLAAARHVPSRPRLNVAEFVFHVFNRAIEDGVLFETPGDFALFLRLFRQTADRYPVRTLAYSLMPNHWHLVIWPVEDGALSSFMHDLTMTHAKTWREMRASTGRGALYQGRFKAVPIQRDDHFLCACRYVERNPLRARLVARAEEWEWSSASPLTHEPGRPVIAPWPVERPRDWLDLLNVPEPPRTLEEIRRAVRKGVPFGDVVWSAVATGRLTWPVHGGQAGRPRAGLRV